MSSCETEPEKKSDIWRHDFWAIGAVRLPADLNVSSQLGAGRDVNS